MTKRGINSKELVEMTGINKSNISAWINDIRPMSQPAKALFYFLFKNWKN
ncbi:helix-turn-helix domain-containing protein [Membranihabitans marinus]